ncbi:MAG: hypothetical protein LBT60_03665 [Oscillospiraceae bacterium]|jgi:hypothetical protein|nr:hypothetical protein [Oscillospiraceae bacterium]
MMDWIRDWLLGIVAAGAATAAAQALAPHGAARQVARLAGGLLLLLVVARPLTQAVWADLTPLGADMQAETARYATQAEQAGTDIAKKLIEEKTSAYIETEAKSRGLSLRAEVEAESVAGQSLPLPARVRLIPGADMGAADKSAFSDWLAGTLNIPAARQRWEAGG